MIQFPNNLYLLISIMFLSACGLASANYVGCYLMRPTKEFPLYLKTIGAGALTFIFTFTIIAVIFLLLLTAKYCVSLIG